MRLPGWDWTRRRLKEKCPARRLTLRGRLTLTRSLIIIQDKIKGDFIYYRNKLNIMKFSHLSETVKIKKISEKNNAGVFEIDGLFSGYGLTVGNALRRALYRLCPERR